MTKTSQDNNLNYINFLKHFYEYHTEKLKYRDVTCLILKVLPWWIWYYCFCSHIQSLVVLDSVIVATAPPLTLSKLPLLFSLFGSGWCCSSATLALEKWRLFRLRSVQTAKQLGFFFSFCHAFVQERCETQELRSNSVYFSSWSLCV